jgi:hypothetical protein
MALTMLDKTSDTADKSAWPPAIAAEFERERQNPNGCVGNMLLSESERVRVWMIRLAPGQRFGFHRHVLDYFWTNMTGGRGRQYKVHDLENIDDKEMVFMTIEFLNSANKPLAIPDQMRAAA